MVNQWIIYDTYEQHEIEKEKFEERERKKGRLSEHEGTSDKGKNSKKEQGVKNRDEIDKIISEKFMKAAKILERMVNQGIYDQVIKGVYDMKLKYWRWIQNYIKSQIQSLSHINSMFFVDFKYYTDPSDDFREKEGTLLPLWKFSYAKAKSLDVTGLCWNPGYKDLFAVAYGSCKCNFKDNYVRTSLNQ